MDDDQWDEAAAAWQQGLEIEATPIAYLNLGTVEYHRGNFQLAADHFRDGIYLWSEFYPLWGKLGAALERLGQHEESQSSFENAANYAEAAIEINAKDARAMYYLASYLAHLGRFEEAARWSRQALDLAPEDAAAHYFAAVVASLSNNDAAAIDALANALQRGYSQRIIRQDPYFQAYLESARLAEWLQEGP
jgi:tetratricopeptide (TPR) repeat protein